MSRPVIAPCCRALIVLSSLFAFCFPAFAGEYIVTYSVQAGNSDKCTYTVPTTTNNVTKVSGSLSGSWATTQSFGTPNNQPTSYSGKCASKIVATFTWSSATSEPPPKSAIVTQTASGYCKADWLQPAPGLVDASDGLGTPSVPVETTDEFGNESKTVSVGVTKYDVESGSNMSSFERDCTPTASLSGTGAVGPPGGTGMGVGNVSYSASAQAVEIALTGTTPDALNKPALLTGQGVTANLVGVSLPSNFQWSVTGAVFKDFTVTANSAGQPQGLGYKTGLGGIFLQETTLSFVTLKEEEITVNCTADAFLPDGSTKSNLSQRFDNEARRMQQLRL